ncbi:MAG: hypothetical protein IIA40_09385, partial [SAR324 cluster bacterium]|nr:hypothetical protein [SAR324 cluster bacterium]
MNKVLAATLVTGLVLFSAPAFAVVYKNPAHSFSEGKFGVGVSFESFSRDVESEGLGDAELDTDQITANFTIGLATGGALGLHAGLVDSQLENQESSDGTAFGISYRHNLDPDGGELQKGFFLSFRSAFVDNEFSETDATQFDGGFGVALPIADNAALYGGGVLSDALSGEILRQWDVAGDRFDPAEYRVEIQPKSGPAVVLAEDETGVWREEESGRTALS